MPCALKPFPRNACSENGANGPSIPKFTWPSARIGPMRFGTIPAEREPCARFRARRNGHPSRVAPNMAQAAQASPNAHGSARAWRACSLEPFAPNAFLSRALRAPQCGFPRVACLFKSLVNLVSPRGGGHFEDPPLSLGCYAFQLDKQTDKKNRHIKGLRDENLSGFRFSDTVFAVGQYRRT